jgi:hypothetical protein
MHLPSTRTRLRFVTLTVSACLACTDPVSPTTATIYFEIDAPLCSSILPMEFQIDNALVGVDTFRVNLYPNRMKSRAFTVTPGAHTLAARVANGYVWPDSTVNLDAGVVFTDSLPFYCS